MPADGDKNNKGLSKSSSAASLPAVEKDKGLKFNPADGSVIRPQGARDFGRNFDRDYSTALFSTYILTNIYFYIHSFVDSSQAFWLNIIQESHCISGDTPTPTTPVAAEPNAEGGILNRLSKMLGYADQADNSSAASTPTDGTYKPVGDDSAGKYLTKEGHLGTTILVWTSVYGTIGQVGFDFYISFLSNKQLQCQLRQITDKPAKYHPNLFLYTIRRVCMGVLCTYRGEIISNVKGSGWFVLEFALPPFSPPLPSVVQISKHYTH